MTNFQGINEDDHRVETRGRDPRMETLADAGITTALVECYKLPPDPEQDHSDLRAMIGKAEYFRWPHAIPVVGLFDGVRLSEYDLAPYVHSWGFYYVEGVNQADWAEMATVESGRAA